MAEPASARLSIRGLSRSFGATRALSAVELEARPGEIHAVVGENGAGKSTLMRILSGEIRPESGEIRLDGAPFAPASPAEARAAGVTIVSQELSLCPHLTVADNVMLGREPLRFGAIDRPAMRRATESALRQVAGTAPAAWLRPEARVSELPMAGKQLCEIARAVGTAVGGCRVLILDEPTSSLGREDAGRLFELVRKLGRDGVTVLYVSHFLEEVKALADHYTVLRDGRSVGSGAMSEITLSEMVTLMAGRQIDQLFVRSPHTPGEVVLELRELGAEPKPVRASLELRRGEVLGIAGLVGAGRTELLRAIFGLEAVRRGTIRVKAYTGPASPGRRLAQGLGLLSEDRKGEGLAVELSIAENLTLSKPPAVGPLGWIWPSRQRQLGQLWLDRLGIKARDPGQRVRELSGGNQQKVALGRLLHHGLDVLLLDEPTRGIDVGSKAQIYALVDELAKQGKAVLVVSSQLPELLGVCDRICVMRRGELGAARPSSAWTEHSLLEEATGAPP
jgi:ribose transport system ATP-binding protein